MGVHSNEDKAKVEAPKPTMSTASAEAPSAVGGALDFLTLSANLGIDRIDSSIEPYLTEVEKLVKDKLKNVELVKLTKLNNSYAFKYSGPDGYLNFFGLYFASLSDPIPQQFFPQSMKLNVLHEEIKNTYSGTRIRISDVRIIFGGYEGDMERAFKMANTIVTTFQTTSIPEVKNADIGVLLSNEFVVDWRISEARAVEDALSPHGVRPRMDIAMTLKVKIKNDHGREFREFENDYRVVGVIGGYTEIHEKEPRNVNGAVQMMYQPVFNITVCNSVIPLEGVASVLLAAFAPTIYTTKFWAKQWDLTKKSSNPGHLEENPDDRGRPITLTDQNELLDFINTYFAQPHIAFQFRDGADGIPGLYRLGSSNPDQKNILVSRLASFYKTEAKDASNVELARTIETRSEGVYGDTKGTLNDSRDIDYLWVANHQGFGAITREVRAILLGCSENASDRAQVVSNATGSFIPVNLTTVSVINPEFVKWIIGMADGSRLQIIDPNSKAASRSIGSYISDFGTATGIGSIVSNGIVNRSLNLGSMWG
jgi:hypothetical protein